MIKNVHLGFFINEYNKEPIWTDLITFEDVDELDRFMDKFYNDNKKIRESFDQDIGEYAIDNIGQFREMDDIIHGNFKGRIAAYYINRLGQMVFIELPTPKKKLIRDYHKIPDFKTAYKYLCDVFDEAVKKINKKHPKEGPAEGEFVHYICEKLYQSGYEVSDNELYYLVTYYYNQNDKKRKAYLDLLKINVRRYYLAKAIKEYDEKMAKEEPKEKPKEKSLDQKILDKYFDQLHVDNEIINIANQLAEPEEEFTYSDSASNSLQYDLEKAKETQNDDYLYLNHDLDELIRDTNIERRKR